MAARGVALAREFPRDGFLACGAALVAFVVYLFTLPPSFGMWDTAELQTVAAILGIAHPPGSPAFALLGYAFVHVLPIGNMAWRLSIMCALSVATSVALAYAVARWFTVSRPVAMVCAIAFALSLVVWRDATRAETQDLALLARVVALAFGLRWYAGGNVRDLFAMSFAFGIGCATHGLALFVLPSLVLLACGRGGRSSARALAIAVGGFCLGVSPYAYLPLRSWWIDAHNLDPLLALGLPPGSPFWNYGDPSNPANFIHFVTAADFHVRGGFAGYLDVARYPHFAAALSRHIAQAYGYVGTLLALGGAILAVASRRVDRIAIVLAGIAPVPYTQSYTDLQDPERYYLLTFWCAAILAGIAFEQLATLFDLRSRSFGRYLLVAIFAATFVTAAPERSNLLGQRFDLTGPGYVADVRAFTPDNAIILADWSYATPLAYAAYVDRALGHRTVIAANEKQYLTYAATWVQSRPVYFVGFNDDLQLRGWHVRRVESGEYFAYRLSK